MREPESTKQYLGGARAPDVRLSVVDVTPDGRGPDVRRQDEALPGEAVPLAAHRGEIRSR